MRPLWSGAISFGLINIPIKIYPAVKSSVLDLDMLDSRDLSNIKFKRVNENTGKEVSYEDIVRGYKTNEHYVVLQEEDFAAAAAEKTNTINVLNFSDEGEIDSIYFEQPYYLEPEKGAFKAYALLREAMYETGKVGVTTFVLRKKETLAILKPSEKAIVLNRIRYEEDIRDFSELNLPEIEKKKTKELEMAIRLIEQQTEKFNISKYKDEYNAKLLEIIDKKSKGKKISKPKMKVVHREKEADLMSILKASLGQPKKKVA